MGRSVLLIHGFPESWYSWRYQLPALAAAGYHAVALDVRGYGRSSKPTTVPDYRMVKKVGDVVGLVAELGGGSGDGRRPRLGRADRVDERVAAAGSVSRCRPVCRCRTRRRQRRPGLDRPSGCARRRAKRTNFTSSISSNRGAPKRRSKRTCAQWLLGFYWCASGDVRNGPNISIVQRGTKLRDKFVYPADDAEMAVARPISTSTRASSSIRDFSVRCRVTATSIATGKISPGSPIGRSRFRRCSSAVRATARRSGEARHRTLSRDAAEAVTSEIIDGAGHWIQQEAAPRTNELLIEFLRTIH